MSIEKAIEAARSNPIRPKGRNSISRFAAILTDGRNSFIGLNSYKSHPLQAKFGCTEESVHIHAEIAAIIKAIRSRAKEIGSHYNDITDLSSYKIYVARVLKNGQPAIAKPCMGCMSALSSFGITDMEWTI